MNKIYKLLPLLALALLPQLASAQTLGNFAELLGAFGGLINLLIPILIAVAVVVFIFNIIKFIVNANDAENRKEASRGIIFSLIGIFVIVSLFAIVRALQKAFGVEDQNVVTDENLPIIDATGSGLRDL